MTRPSTRLKFLLAGGAVLLPAVLLADGRVLPGRAVDTPSADRPAATTPVRQQRMVPQVVANQSEGTVYARRDGSAVRAGAARTSATIGEYNAGTPFAVLAREPGRLQVRTPDGSVGYISPLNVTDEAPRQQRSSRGIFVSDDLGPGERADVTAIRGLSPVSEQYATDAAIPDEVVAQVRAMEQRGEGITDAEVDRFMDEGGIIPQ